MRYILIIAISYPLTAVDKEKRKSVYAARISALYYNRAQIE
jgi:hypothetical protein